MSKKDYELVARAIQSAHQACIDGYTSPEFKLDLAAAFQCVRSSLIAAFEDDNKRFDGERFTAACTPKGERR